MVLSTKSSKIGSLLLATSLFVSAFSFTASAAKTYKVTTNNAPLDLVEFAGGEEYDGAERLVGISAGDVVNFTINEEIGYDVKTLTVINQKTGDTVLVTGGSFIQPAADVKVNITWQLSKGYHYVNLGTSNVSPLPILDGQTKIYLNNFGTAAPKKLEGSRAVVKEGAIVTLNPIAQAGADVTLTKVVGATGRTWDLFKDADAYNNAVQKYHFVMPAENVSAIYGSVSRYKVKDVNDIDNDDDTKEKIVKQWFTGIQLNGGELGAIGKSNVSINVQKLIAKNEDVQFTITTQTGLAVNSLTGVTGLDTPGTPVLVHAEKDGDSYLYHFKAPAADVILKANVVPAKGYHAIKVASGNSAYTVNGDVTTKVVKDGSKVTINTADPSKITVNGGAVKVTTSEDNKTFTFKAPEANVNVSIVPVTGKAVLAA